MPPNVNKTILRFVMENGVLLPTGPENLNEKCVLTVHPLIGLKNCSYSHVIDGRIKPAKIQHRKCPTRMVIFVPVEDTSDLPHKALLILSHAHNHPAHPTTKPKFPRSTQTRDRSQRGGPHRFKGSKTSQWVAENSPVFADSRKVRDFISVQKKEYPCGMGWEGVLYELREREVKLPIEERYIHTAMDKGGFRVLPAPEPAFSNLPVLPMPQPSPPSIVATIEEEIPALPSRKRSRQAEVDERNIIEGSRHRVKSRRAQGEL
ncbi:hypothetical protein B0H11DRAFT_1917715 [Mycena galericulata]|nr:hypothetical protein B0H11DRAFT_1917715 [Mycena galericulata]